MAILEHMVERNVDGILLFAVGQGDELCRYLNGLPFPIVCMGNRLSGSSASPCTSIGLDDRGLLYRATKDIVSMGYDAFAFVAPYLATAAPGDNDFEAKERRAGFSRALSEKGIEGFILDDWDYLDRIEKLIRDGRRLAAICTSDIFALETIMRVQDLGFSIPDDIGVMGFDDLDILRYISPSLSTIKYPIKEMALTAVERLYDEIKNPGQKKEDLFIPTEIVWRDSI
jgi:LacI family transcriptional regulator